MNKSKTADYSGLVCPCAFRNLVLLERSRVATIERSSPRVQHLSLQLKWNALGNVAHLNETWWDSPENSHAFHLGRNPEIHFECHAFRIPALNLGSSGDVLLIPWQNSAGNC